MAVSMSPTIRLLVGSSNPVKLEGARRGVSLGMSNTHVLATPYNAPSNVSEQPFGDCETLAGALNRLKATHAEALRRNDLAQDDAEMFDFVASIEGGCAWRAADGSEGGPKDALACFAWATVQDLKSGVVGRSRSAEFVLPASIAQRVADGEELGPASDAVFGTVDIKRGGGTIGALTNGTLTRAAYYEQPFLLACLPFVEGTGRELYH
ncbi:inosine/xanthosine triphosphatase [Pseudoscourfieldia marina]